MGNIKLAICDDSKQMCKFFEYICKKEDDIDFVGATYSSNDCLELVKKHLPDILLLDIQMEEYDSGVKLIPKIKEIHPDIKVIMFTAHKEDEYIFSSFVEGAADFMLKTLTAEEMLSTIRNVGENKSFLRPEIASVLAKKCQEVHDTRKSLLYLVSVMTKLSTSEFEVLLAAYNGDSYSEIAEKRFVSVSTINTLASRVINKFDAVSMKELIEKLRELRILELFGEHRP